MGDTSSPASDLLLVPDDLETLLFVVEQHGSNPFAFQGFPTELFTEVTKINYLRMQASKRLPVEADDLVHEATRILTRVQRFSPEKWADSKPSQNREAWVLLGMIRRASIILYCIYSLQSVCVLPDSPFYRDLCELHSQNLHLLLQRAVVMPSLKLFMLWPLLVLGVSAVHGSLEMRGFVRFQLPEISKYTGMLAPLTAKSVLERFWDSGYTTWDQCFDRPYAFIMQPSVERSKI